MKTEKYEEIIKGVKKRIFPFHEKLQILFWQIFNKFILNLNPKISSKVPKFFRSHEKKQNKKPKKLKNLISLIQFR